MAKIIFAAIVVLVVGGIIILLGGGRQEPVSTSDQELKSTVMKLTSQAFENNQPIPSKYTCDGEDVNPPLSISDAPSAAKSMVLIVDDPDAPAGDWVHWTVWNIDASIKSIAENSVPEGALQGETDFGKLGYGGPCPPTGTHRYQFKLYALDTSLDLVSQVSKADIESAIKGHILDQTLLIGLYKRQ